jgi:hypothetical protein
MLVRIALLICTLAMLSFSAAAQKTVTNGDLERYRTERVRAEDQLRQEYAKKGISPEDVARRNKESQKEMIALSAKLRAERLEAERLAAEREAAARAAAAERQSATTVIYQDPYWNGGWNGGYVYGYGGRHLRYGHLPYQQPGYFAGGQFWPTGPATPPLPPIRIRGRHR